MGYVSQSLLSFHLLSFSRRRHRRIVSLQLDLNRNTSLPFTITRVSAGYCVFTKLWVLVCVFRRSHHNWIYYVLRYILYLLLSLSRARAVTWLPPFFSRCRDSSRTTLLYLRHIGGNLSEPRHGIECVFCEASRPWVTGKPHCDGVVLIRWWRALAKERKGFKPSGKPSSTTNTGGTDHMSNNHNTKEEPVKWIRPISFPYLISPSPSLYLSVCA